ncbi:MAG: WG repeat-containing protein [Tannerella sp.]|nr:WG repeat-containing protein [Tannerella sp.]
MKGGILTAIVVSMGWLIFFACGHEYQGKLSPKQDERTGKWGYADTLGKIVISPKWDMAGPFFEGLAVVGQNDKYGFIDPKGVEVIPFKYDRIGNFSEDGLAKAKWDGKWGYMDKTGQEIIPAKYDEIGDFSEDGLAKAKRDGKWSYIDKTGKEVSLHLELDKKYAVQGFEFTVQSVKIHKGGYPMGMFYGGPSNPNMDPSYDGVLGIVLTLTKGDIHAFSKLDKYLINEKGVRNVEKDNMEMFKVPEYTVLFNVPVSAKKIKFGIGDLELNLEKILSDNKKSDN